MPNGDAEQFEKELPEIEAFFQKFSDSLVIFAKKHKLVIDKYFHHLPDWTFRFRHPKGGQGCIVVRKEDCHNVFVSSSWWKDNYESNRRDFMDADSRICAVDHVVKILEKILREILSWDISDLKKGTANPCFVWKNEMTREEFEKEDDHYPIAKL
ncbi:MAG: hypothetical protein JW749_02540 [Sedimentisphaerales bacterium]|nr:hypothetical protein [Sedimentisphaerales bacterium]